MSCLGKKYNPVPTKEWYRFENQCVYNTQSLGSIIKNKKLAYEIAVLDKGNVLQYKKNSSNLTKNQRYSQIARAAWANRKKTWATQTQTYTNPDTTTNKRVNYTEKIINPVTAQTQETSNEDGVIEPLPPEEPQNGFIPSSTGRTGFNPLMPPPIDPKKTSPYPLVPNSGIPPKLVTTVVIPDGGNMLCNVYAKNSTGPVFLVTKNNYCNPLSASDVPGPTYAPLCYNSSVHPTYYTKVRRTYGTAGDKWPQGAKLIFPA
jgi:hypothetical protein